MTCESSLPSKVRAAYADDGQISLAAPARCGRRAAERRGMRCCLSALVPHYEETCMCPHGAGEPPLPGTPLVDILSWRAHAGSSMGASMPFCLALM